MDHETVSRKEKIEMARRQVGNKSSRTTGYREVKEEAEIDSGTGRFFLRLLLSIFVFLAILSVTEFEAMGEQKAEEYKAGIERVLRTQNGLEKIKTMLRS